MLIAAQRRGDATSMVDVGPLLRELAVRQRANADGQPELTVRSPFAYLGYITESGPVPPDLDDGYMPTGDMGEMTDGRLRITGRLKDLIIRGGVNIAPVTLENALAGLPGLEDVAVIGVPHEFWGEAIVVCVQSAAGADVQSLEQAVRARCRERLARSHHPDRIVMLERFPRCGDGQGAEESTAHHVGRMILGFAHLTRSTAIPDAVIADLTRTGKDVTARRKDVPSAQEKWPLLDRKAKTHELAPAVRCADDRSGQPRYGDSGDTVSPRPRRRALGNPGQGAR